MDGPNLFRAGRSTLWALRVARPKWDGSGTASHEALSPVLAALAQRGGLGNVDPSDLDAYLSSLDGVDPLTLTRAHALAFWINLYNAFAVRLALEARQSGASSVLEVRSGFDTKRKTIGGESLSLSDIEHGKIRRFGDPRIHGSLVCGSLSCPSLRPEPFDGSSVDEQLDHQMRVFLSSGAAALDRSAGQLHLSRVFLWYGSDFVRPHRMPTFVPASKARVAAAAAEWLGDEDRAWVVENSPDVVFQSYDWGLGCAVA